MHQAIIWTIVDSSLVRSIDIHLRAVSQEMPQLSITRISLKITYSKSGSNFSEANELIWPGEQCGVAVKLDYQSLNPLRPAHLHK